MKSLTNNKKNLPNAPRPDIETELKFEGGVSRQMLSGVKRLTILMGKRRFQRSIKIHDYAAIVESVRHTTLLHMGFRELKEQGFSSMFNTLLVLKRFYPTIDINSTITVVEYRLLPY